MPELPEVETMRRAMAEAEGLQFANVKSLRCRLKPILIQPPVSTFRRRAKGRLVRSVDRAGKRVVFRLEGGYHIVVEPRMTGLLLVADPPNKEHLRLQLDFGRDNGLSAWYWDRRGLGSVRLLNTDEYQAQLGPHRLGPDALKLTREQMRERLHKSRREIKTALLDQRAIAGIGNLYASEILHLARVHPRARCDRVSGIQWKRIHRSTIEVLETAIEYEGSTLADGTYRNALNSPGQYQNRHRVYDRAGRPCPSCNSGRIRRVVQAQRSTFYCSSCQKKAS